MNEAEQRERELDAGAFELARRQYDENKLRAREQFAPPTVHRTREGALLPPPTLGVPIDEDAQASAIRYIRSDLYERPMLALGECKVLLGLSWLSRSEDVVEKVRELLAHVKELEEQVEEHHHAGIERDLARD